MKTIVKTAAFVAVLAAASVAVAQDKVTISIATGPTGGVLLPARRRHRRSGSRHSGPRSRK